MHFLTGERKSYALFALTHEFTQILARSSVATNGYATIAHNDSLSITGQHSGNGGHTPKSQLVDEQWPTTQYPTPYEIFGISALDRGNLSSRDKTRLKKTYHKYVKMYHPDLSISRDILDASRKNQLLTVEEKVARFKMISQAYGILTNANKKHLYDLNRSNWSHNGPSQNINDLYKSNNFTSDDTYQYWHAGTWEDMNRFNERGDSKEKEFERHKHIIFWAIGMLICIEGSMVLTKIENSLVDRSTYGVTENDIEHGLFRSYQNYGLDDDKLSRIKRFLWFRSWGLYSSKEELDREAKFNEDLIGTISDPETGQLVKKSAVASVAPPDLLTAQELSPVSAKSVSLEETFKK